MAEDTPRPAATVVVLRDSTAGPEVFMVRRHVGTAFRGAHVFQGGRVDQSDGEHATGLWCDGIEHAARQLPTCRHPRQPPFTSPRCGELFEEAGVLLARGTRPGSYPSPTPRHTSDSSITELPFTGAVNAARRRGGESLHVALDALLLFAHWVTPPLPIEGRRFDTPFLITRVPAGQIPAHDDRETTDGVWLTPRDAIARAVRREIVLPPPTWVTLRELEPQKTVNGALAWAAARRVARREPSTVVDDNGGRVLVMPLDDGPDPIHYERRFALRDGAWGPVEERTS